jgi:hypothetical protein
MFSYFLTMALILDLLSPQMKQMCLDFFANGVSVLGNGMEMIARCGTYFLQRRPVKDLFDQNYGLCSLILMMRNSLLLAERLNYLTGKESINFAVNVAPATKFQQLSIH